MIDFVDVLTDPELSQWVALRRATAVVRADGTAAVIETSTQQILAVIQPVAPEALAVYAPEGERLQGAISVWSQSLLRAAGENHAADMLDYQGTTFRVHAVNTWTCAGLFYNATCLPVAL